LDAVAISIDGRPDEHDRIRRRPGAFERTVANLETIRSSGVPFGFIFTLTQFNADSVEFVVRLAAETGARGVQIHPLTLHGRATSEMADARPDDRELLAGLIEGSRLARELGIHVHVDALSAEQLEPYRDRLVPSRPITSLTDVAPLLVVEASGRVLPLTHEIDPRLQIGSLKSTRLSALATSWLVSGLAEDLVEACERTWDELVRERVSALYWYDEVAARTRVQEKLAS